MSYFIIIRGPLGSGKTIIARKLAEVLRAEYISIDEILEKHGLDKVAPREECIPAANFIKANTLVLPKAIKYLQKRKVVIFDACFYHQEQIKILYKTFHLWVIYLL